MLGNPKYKEGDIVHFNLIYENQNLDISGEVYIVDAHGTFEQSDEPSYDILVEDWCGTCSPMLVKHIRESSIISHEDEVKTYGSR